MSKLLDALKARFRSPQEVAQALGLDEALLDETNEKPAIIAHDERPVWRDYRWDSPRVAGDNQGEE